MDSNDAPKDSIVPPFLAQSKGSKGNGSPVTKPARFVQVDPVQLKFQLGEHGPCKKTLLLTNVSGLRIAWRIRSNAPTRYVVNPASGFLTANEAQTVNVELSDSNKYSERHRFMVQAMEAKDDEKDRRKIWDDNRATQLDLVQCVRVFTIGTGAVSDQHMQSIINKASLAGSSATASASGTSITSDTSMTSSTSNGSSTSSGTSLSSAASSVSGSTTASSSSSCASTTESIQSCSTATSAVSALSEYSDKIAELTALAKNSFAEEKKVSQQMVQAVNEVKHLEVELDRAAQQSNELENRQKSLAVQIDLLEKRSKSLDDEIKALMNTDGTSSMK